MFLFEDLGTPVSSPCLADRGPLLFLTCSPLTPSSVPPIPSLWPLFPLLRLLWLWPFRLLFSPKDSCDYIVLSQSVVSDSLQPHGLQPAKLLCPWGFSRQEYWRGLPPPGDLPNPGIEPRSPALQADSLPSEPPGKPKSTGMGSLSLLQVRTSRPRNQPGVSSFAGRFFTSWATKKVLWLHWAHPENPVNRCISMSLI